MKDVYNALSGTEKIVIFGAGTLGQRLCRYFRNEGKQIECFMDNHAGDGGKELMGIAVKKPFKLDDESAKYIIALQDADVRKEILGQLCGLGVLQEHILEYGGADNRYIRSLPEERYQETLDEMYYERFGKRINWDAPQTYNEIINWEKIYARDPKKTRLADKCLVRDWVKEQIGEEHLTRWYGCWDSPEEIDFDALPDSFALKLNNGSGRNIIVKDKREINVEEICRQLNEWKNTNYAFDSLELQYRDIVPKIICEEYLEGMAETVYDYNIYCFHGKPEYVWCIRGSHRPGCKASFYDTDWNMQTFNFGYPWDEIEAPRPEKLDEMLKLSEILCKDFKHVRVDWYNLPDGRVLFGEITFSSWSGLNDWNPPEYDAFFGRLIRENSREEN